ncbi:glycine cleavage system P-protein-domain-containing protein [Cladorrhinum samala]|uniref:Glycine cleavage system P protein n=1 Tax=Cladorrhinum samala TaxID=585594 RepID=A0AAV9HM96_9PEZI|nr:glycine cleavage system P-protein-domain-containing protein [Cladorrhinum samala]
MAVLRQIGRLGRPLGSSVLTSRTAAPLLRTYALASRRYSTQSSETSSPEESTSSSSEAQPESLPVKRFISFPKLFPVYENFSKRHIGPDDQSVQQMMSELSPPANSMEEFVKQVVPADILTSRPLFQSTVGYEGAAGTQEVDVKRIFASMQSRNEKSKGSLYGGGYYNTHVPEVIKRNILESPAWYTSYTPYQPEISQGRLESLLNFQTMVSDLTGLPIANASLLDEGTAGAEAMTMSLNTLPASRAARPGKTFVVSDKVNPKTIAVLRGRAEGFGVKITVADLSSDYSTLLESLGDDLVGVMVQYPDNHGKTCDFRGLADAVHKQGVLLSAATDLLALTLLTPPGEWGADIAFGNSQRFGVPLGYGGPHAAFFAVKEKHKRKMPGRLIGVSKDRLGGRALRLSLQTREQHIRREKATSNVCTAQALLANMAAMYAVYHGPEGLKQIAERTHLAARVIQAAARLYNFDAGSEPVAFDTVTVKWPGKAAQMVSIAWNHYRLGVRYIDEDTVGISADEAVNEEQLLRVVKTFATCALRNKSKEIDHSSVLQKLLEEQMASGSGVPESLRRQSSYLTHPVFNSHHSETELLRYIHHLQSKDLSLVHSMIPLGSCTMKLNGSTEMSLITDENFANLHPLSPLSHVPGAVALVLGIQTQLTDITGMDGCSIQPNSGAQGEFAGLKLIRRFHWANGEANRDICLIPVSAHGTNPASAAMAGMRVVPVKCNSKTGNLDIADLEAKCQQYSSQIGAIMITYPSTFGVFEPEIKKACEIVHSHGGQVYMDGANMNAQIGLCSPGEIGADVCHLNLHKTFCIPHGGGGPGVGPICVKKHLMPFISNNHPVSSATFGSTGILPISWAYNLLMGGDGLKKATEVTLLNANYIMSKLKGHYQILYTNEHGRCAHEFILDARPFHDTAGVEAIDIAKRLQDYGFHAPTMSWPVANTLMIEPTESESKEELDRFIDALISIRAEIREIEEGKAPREGNVLKMAPHPMADIIAGDGEAGTKWDRPYSREKAAYPLPWLKEKKFWPSVGRVDDAYGDLNLFCTCPPVEDTTGGNLSSVQDV